MECAAARKQRWWCEVLAFGSGCARGVSVSGGRPLPGLSAYSVRAFLDHFDVGHQPNERSPRFVLDENVVLGGDFGWDDDLDGPLRLGDGGWVDAWRELRGGGDDEEDNTGGWTYDAVANPMVRCLDYLPVERRRPDRFICKLRDFTLRSIEMVGEERIPGVTRFGDGGKVLPVLPSHHYGLLLTISPKHNN
nr:unnamed protein product [Digitaria exilis]